MKLAVALAVVSAMCCGQEAQAKVSAGAVAVYPEWFGLYVSALADRRHLVRFAWHALDGRCRRDRAHPVGGQWRVGATRPAGARFGGLRPRGCCQHGVDASRGSRPGAVGYGLQAGWDVRVLAGVSAAQGMVGWATGFTGMAYVGHSF